VRNAPACPSGTAAAGSDRTSRLFAFPDGALLRSEPAPVQTDVLSGSFSLQVGAYPLVFGDEPSRRGGRLGHSFGFQHLLSLPDLGFLPGERRIQRLPGFLVGAGGTEFVHGDGTLTGQDRVFGGVRQRRLAGVLVVGVQRVDGVFRPTVAGLLRRRCDRFLHHRVLIEVVQ